jgi:signal recognition particle GTPase
MFNYKIEHKPRSTVDSFRIGKQKLLDEVKNKPIIEASIKKQLKDNMFNSMKEYFSLDDLLSIEEIKKHFNIFVITGDRNIGKSTAGKVYCENLVAQGHKFV